MTQVYRFNDKYGEFEVRADHDWEATAQASIIRADRAATWHFQDSGKPMTEEYKAEMIRRSGEHVKELEKHISWLDDAPRRREAARQNAIDTFIELGYHEPDPTTRTRQSREVRPQREDDGGFVGSPMFCVLVAMGLIAAFALYALAKAHGVMP